MSNFTRRDFMALSGLAAGGAAAGGCARPGGNRGSGGGAGGGHADLVVRGATLYTVDDDLPRAEAFAVKSGRFLAVGSNADVSNLIGPSTAVIEGGGMTVVPGFIDAHNHPFYSGTKHLKQVSLDVRSIEAIKSALGERAQNTPQGQWVQGFLYDDTKIEDGRPLTRADIDEAVPDHPVSVTHRGGHTGVYNSRAFEVAGITADTPDPPGGMYYRENGELTGRVAERAKEPLESLIPAGTTRAERQESIRLIGERMAAAGLTSVHETGAGNDLVSYQDAYDAGELRFRAYVFPNGGSGLFPALKAAGIRTGFGDDWVKVGGIKYGADGSASERTMAMSTPYVGRPDDYGILTMNQEEIHEAVDDAVRNGWQVGIHANGDLAIEMCLNAFERAQREMPQADPRFRLEHCSLVNDDLLRRIRDVGAIPTPFYTYVPLSRKQVGRIRRREDGMDVRAPPFPRLWNPGGGRLRLSAGTVRGADGHSEHGHAHGHAGARVGSQPEDLRRGSAARLHHQWRARGVRGRDQGIDHGGQAGRLRDPRRRPAHRRSLRDQGDRDRAHRRRRANHLRSLR